MAVGGRLRCGTRGCARGPRLRGSSGWRHQEGSVLTPPQPQPLWGSPPSLLQGPRNLGAPAGPHALPAAAARLMTGGTDRVSLEGKPPNHQLLLNSVLEFRRDLVLKGVGHVLVWCRLHRSAFRVELSAAVGSLSTSLPRRRVSDLRQQAGHASRVQAQPGGKREKQMLCRGLEKGTHSGAREPRAWAQRLGEQRGNPPETVTGDQAFPLT